MLIPVILSSIWFYSCTIADLLVNEFELFGRQKPHYQFSCSTSSTIYGSNEISADGSPHPLPKISVDLDWAAGKLIPPELLIVIGLKIDGVRSCMGPLLINFWLGLRRFLNFNFSGYFWLVAIYFLALLLFGYFFRNFCVILCLLWCLFVPLLFPSLFSLSKNLFCSLPLLFTGSHISLIFSLFGVGKHYSHFDTWKAISFFILLSWLLIFAAARWLAV